MVQSSKIQISSSLLKSQQFKYVFLQLLVSSVLFVIEFLIISTDAVTHPTDISSP